MKRIPPKLALPWILEEDWPQWQAVDHGVPTYEKWVELFDKNLKLAESYGWPYERVSIRPDPFNEWCKANQRSVAKFDRSLYALELLRNGVAIPPAEDKQPAADHVTDNFASTAEPAASSDVSQPISQALTAPAA